MSAAATFYDDVTTAATTQRLVQFKNTLIKVFNGLNGLIQQQTNIYYNDVMITFPVSVCYISLLCNLLGFGFGLMFFEVSFCFS